MLDIGRDRFADMFKCADQEAAGTCCRITKDFSLLWIKHADHEIHHRAGREELPKLAPESVPKDLLEGEALDVVAGFREVEALQFLDDAAEGFLRNLQPVGVGKQVVGLVKGLRLFKEPIMDLRVGRHSGRCAPVEEVHGKGAVQAGTFDIHLHEQDLRNGVEGAARVHLVHVAQDRVALEQKVLEFLAVEHAQLAADFFDPLGVAPVGRLCDLVDLHEVAGRAGHQLEDGREAVVGGDEEFRPGRPGVAFALVIVAEIDLDAFGFALDDLHRRNARPSRCFRGGFPDHDVGAGAAAARDHPHFLPHLLKRITVVFAQVADELLSHQFFRLAGAVAPFRLERQPNPGAFLVDGLWCRGPRRRRGRFRLLRCGHPQSPSRTVLAA